MPGTVSRRLLYRFFVSALSLLLALYPDLVYAQQAASSIIVDNTTDPSAAAPSLDRTANGVEQVDIATPNSAGLSHNLFTQYNVEQKGLILNNATEATQTQLGGYVYANSNLKGSSAKVILNEVTGQQASQMLGYTEVAGQKANVVIANPNGITCNGCGFLNTSRVTLASGHPELDASGALSALTVTDGLVAFGRNGGNFTAVPVLDIFSRRIVLDGQVNAQTVQMAAGRNRIDYSSGAVHPLSSDGSQVPEFAIDSSAFGGMYAGRISMLVNEAGAGVRVDGQMAANAGDMTLTADGQLVLNGSMSATGNITVTAGGVQNTGALQASGSASIATQRQIETSGQMTAGTTFSVSGAGLHNTGHIRADGTGGAHFALSGTVDNAGTVSATTGSLGISGQQITNEANAQLLAQTGLTAKSATDILNNGAIITNSGAAVITAVGNITQNDGTMAAAGGDMSVAAATLLNTGGSIIAASQDTTIHADEVANEGTVSSSGDSNLYVVNALTNSGIIQSNSALFIQSSSFSNSGVIYGETNVALNIDQQLDNTKGQIGAGAGPVSLVTGALNNTGGKIVASSRDLTIQSRSSVINDSGIIAAKNGSLTLSGGAISNGATGSISAAAQGNIVATDTLSSDGSIQAGSALTVSANNGITISAKGQIIAISGPLLLDTGNGSLSSSGQIGTSDSGDVQLTATDATNAGVIQSAGHLTVNLSGRLSNSGQVLAIGGNLSVNASDVATSGTLSAIEGSINTLVSDSLQNSGTIYGARTATLQAGGLLSNADGQIGAGGGALSLSAESVDNSAGKIITSLNDLTIASRSSIVNDSGIIASKTGSLTLSGNSILNGDAGSIQSNSALLVQSASLSNGGTISGEMNVTLNIDQQMDNVKGQIGSESGPVSVVAGALDNTDGKIVASSGDLTVQSRSSVINSNGVISSGKGNLLLSGNAVLNDDAGLMSASAQGKITATDTLSSDGVIQTGSALTVFANNGMTVGAKGQIIALSGPLLLDATNGDLSISGQIGTSDSGNVQLTATDVTNAGVIQSAGDLTANLSGNLSNSGQIMAVGGDLSVKASDVATSGTFSSSEGAVTVLVADALKNSGTIYGETVTTLQAGGLLSNLNGQIGAGAGAIALSAVFLDNDTGKIIASGNSISVISQKINNNSGIIQGKDDVFLLASSVDNRNGGGIFSLSGDLSLKNPADNTLTVMNQGGQIEAGQSLTLLASTYAGDAKSEIFGQKNLSLTASGNIDNNGKIIGGDTLSIITGKLENNTQGVIAAAAGSASVMVTGADGLTNFGIIETLSASGALTINTPVLSNAGTVLSDGSLQIVVENTLTNSGKLGNLVGDLTINSAVLGNTGVLTTAGQLAVNVSSQFVNSGALFATGDVTLTVGQSLTNDTKGQIGSGNGDITLVASAIENESESLIAANGSLSVTADSITNTDAAIQAGEGLIVHVDSLQNSSSGEILALAGGVNIAGRSTGSVKSFVNTGSIIQGLTDISIQSGVFDNTNGTVLSQSGSVTADIMPSGTVSNAGGIIQSAGNLDLSGGRYTSDDNSSLNSGGSLTLTLAGDLANSGQIVAANNLVLSARSLTTQAGATPDHISIIGSTRGNVAITTGNVLNAGEIEADGANSSLTLSANTLENSGKIIGQDTVAVLASGQLSNTGSLFSAAGSLTLAGNGLSNSGLEAATATLTVTSLSDVTNVGTLFGGEGLTLTSGSAVRNTGGQIGAGSGALILTATGVLDNTAGEIIAQGGSLTAEASQFVNGKGLLQASDTDSLKGDGLDNTSGTVLAAHGNIVIESPNGNVGHLQNTGGVIQAGGAVTAAFDSLINSNGHILADGGKLSLTGTPSSDVANTGGAIQTAGSLVLSGGSYTSDADSLLTAGDIMTLSFGGALSNSGQIASTGSLNIGAAAVVNARGGLLTSSQGALALTLAGNAGLSNNGTIETLQPGQALSIVAQALSNGSGGSILSRGGQTLNVAGLLSNAGEITAYDNVLTIAASALDNSDLILSGTGLSIHVSGQLTNAGLLYGVTSNTLNAASLVNAGGQLGTDTGTLDVVTSILDNSHNGRIISRAGDISLQASQIDNQNGHVEAGLGLTTLAASLNNNDGEVISDNADVVVSGLPAGQAGSSVDNSTGILQAGGSVTVHALTMQNTGGTVLARGGDVLLSADTSNDALQSLEDTNGTLQAARDLSLTADALTGHASLSAGRNLTFVTPGDFSTPTTFVSGQNTILRIGGAYTIAAGSGIDASGNATVQATSVTNAGAMMAGGTLTVSTPGAIGNSGLMEGDGSVVIKLDGELTNISAAILSENGSISIGGRSGRFAGAVINRSGEIMANNADGDVSIEAASLTNDILGGVTVTPGYIFYDKKYTLGEYQLSDPPRMNPSFKYYHDYAKYYKQIMKIYVPEEFYSSDGLPGRGYVLAAFNGSNASDFIEVRGTGSQISAANAAALIDAGRDLTIDTIGAIGNDGSHIAAARNTEMTGASLSNTGYEADVTWTLRGVSPYLIRWFPASDPNVILDADPDAATEAPNPSMFGNGDQTQIWGSSVVASLNATIVSGGAFQGNFTGELDNKTIIESATNSQIASNTQYIGTVPSSTPAASTPANGVNGESLTMPETEGGFVPASTTVTGPVAEKNLSGSPSDTPTNIVSGSTAQGISGVSLETPAGAAPKAVSNQEVSAAAASPPDSSGSLNTTSHNTVSAPAVSATSVRLPSYSGLLNAAGHETGAQAGQSLSLPGFSTAAETSVSKVLAAVPGATALYVPNPSPTAGYLIETNPQYTSQKAFDGSEYLLDRLGAQPQDYVFLGDDSFDQRYVQQQIITATGQSYLGTTYTTAAAQMQALVDNAATQSTSLGLTLGQALTPIQQSQLTSDMVWYVSEDVGGKSVLVPKLYLASGHEALTGATITAKNVSLTASSIANSGAITGSNSLNLTATSGNISNTGALSGGDISLAAQNGSIINSDTLSTYLVQGGTQQDLTSVGTITATGSAALAAVKDITFNGGKLSAGSDLSVIAGNGLSLGNTTLKQAASISSWKLSMNASAVQNYGTSISAGGDAALAALGGDLSAGGASLTTGGNLTLSAAKNLDLGSVTNSSTMDVSGHKSGFLTHSSFTNNQSSTTEVGSTVAAGGTLTAVSGGDMTVKGILGATGDAMLLSGGSFTESATKSTSDVSASHHVSGFSLSTQGASGTIGYGSRTDSYSESITQYTPSVIASLSGSLNIASAGKATVDASVISAAKDVLLSGSSVAFTTEQNTATQTVSHKDKSIGLTGGVSPNSIVGQIIDTALSATQTSGKGSATLSALDAMQGAYLAGTGIAAGLQSGAGKLFSLGKEGSASGNTDLIGVQAGLGFSSHSQSTTQSETDVQGSTATAGGTLSVAARGDSASDAANGALSAVAAQLSGQNIELAARDGISLSAGRDTTSTDSRYSSKSAFLGVEGSVGTNGLGLSVAASFGAQKQNAASASSTAVDTIVRASDEVRTTTPGAMALNGAEISGRRVDVSAGSLSITSPQNTSDYHSSATQAGANLSVSFLGAGETGGGASYTHQTITDHYASTEGTLSGLYAADRGLGADVSGNTSLTAGVLSSTGAAALNHFNTGSLSAQGVDNISAWQATQTGASFSAGTGMMGSTTGILGAVGMGLASGASGLMGGGRSHKESSESLSAIGNNIDVTAGSTTGSYTRDVSAADRALQNTFDAQSLNNQLQAQQIGSQLVGEVGGKVSDALQNAGVPGFDETNWQNNYGRALLEAAGNAGVALATGGNAGAAAVGTALSDETIAATSPMVAQWVVGQTSDPAEQQALMGLVMNGIADVAAAGGGAAVGGGSGTTVLNATGMASSVEQNNLVFLIPVILEVAEVAVTAAETGEAAEGAGTAVLSAVRSLLSAGKSADTVSRLLTDMGLNGDVLVHEAKSGKGSSTKASSTGSGASISGGGTAAPQPDGEEPDEKNNRPPNLTPEGAGRSGAFKQAKRDAGIPASQNPDRVTENVDRRGKVQPGKIYEYDMPAPGGGKITIRIRDDSEGHVYIDDPTQNRGPHFNTPDEGHYDYQK